MFSEETLVVEPKTHAELKAAAATILPLLMLGEKSPRVVSLEEPKRIEANQRPEGTTGESSPSNPSKPPGAPHP